MPDAPQEPPRPPLLHYLCALACIVLGVYEFAKPGGLDRWGTAWAATMIVIGVGLLLLGLFLHFVKSEAQAADEIDRLDRQMYGEPHRRKLVDEHVIREYGADVDFYRRRREELAALGFRHVGDYVDVTADAAAPWMRAVIRASSARGARRWAACSTCASADWHACFSSWAWCRA